MGFQLPRSLRKELYTISDEVASVRNLSPEEKIHLVALACRASWKALQYNELRDKILEMRDPLPESTVAALHRLRRGV